MVMREIERRRRLQVEGRYQLHAAATRDQFLMLGSAVLPLRGITGEQDDDSVEIRTAKAVHPIVGVVFARVAENFGSGDHALLEFLRERSQGDIVNPKRLKAVPGKGHRHPTLVFVDRGLHGCGGLHRVENAAEPSSTARRVVKREKFVPPGECGRPGQQDMLNVVELEHVGPGATASGPACARKQP